MSAPLLVVSPHCDDAVFSCGALLASRPGAVVVTVFAGSPARYEPFTAWDRACGYAPGEDVMALRRDEDARALAVLGATPLWLPYLDSQYGPTPAAETLTSALEAVLADHAPGVVVFPLGLFHSDHVVAREAVLPLLDRHRGTRWIAYHDVPYRRIAGMVEAQLDTLREQGRVVDAMETDAAPQAQALKRAAVACYRSQLRGLATPGRLGHLDAFEPETYETVVAVGVTT